MKFQRHLLPQIPFNLSQTPFAKLLPNLPLSHEAKVAFGQNYGDNDGGGNTGTIIIDTRARDEALLTTSRSINDYLKQQIAIGKGGEPTEEATGAAVKAITPTPTTTPAVPLWLIFFACVFDDGFFFGHVFIDLGHQRRID